MTVKRTVRVRQTVQVRRTVSTRSQMSTSRQQSLQSTSRALPATTRRMAAVLSPVFIS